MLAAVSGGPDSLALLGLLAATSKSLGFQVCVAHVDHGIHEASSDVAESVMAVSMNLKVPAYLSTLNLGPDASETAARDARYESLFCTMNERGADWIATAHHADDQVETVLMRALKGSGVAGLASMQPRSGNIIRPLLSFGRGELLEWLESRPDLRRFVHLDPANQNERHDRVWIRRVLRPLLDERFGNEASAQSLLRLGRYASENSAAWLYALDRLPGLDLQPREGQSSVSLQALRDLPDLLARQVIMVAAREGGLRVGPERAGQILEFARNSQSGRGIELDDGGAARIDLGRLRFSRAETVSQTFGECRWGVGVSGEALVGNWRLSWAQAQATDVQRRGWETFVTLGDGEVRSLEPGDRIFPLGGSGFRKARRELMEQGVPVESRWNYPILVRGGQVLWIPGVCRSRVDVPEPGQPALKLMVHET